MLGKPDKSARHVPGSHTHTHTHMHTLIHSFTLVRWEAFVLEAPEGSRNKSHKIMCHEMGIVVAWLHHKLLHSSTPCAVPPSPPALYDALPTPSSIRLEPKESPSRLATWPRFTASLPACHMPHASYRLLANFLQRNFGDASVPPADTATCRAPSSPAPAPAVPSCRLSLSLWT